MLFLHVEYHLEHCASVSVAPSSFTMMTIMTRPFVTNLAHHVIRSLLLHPCSVDKASLPHAYTLAAAKESSLTALVDAGAHPRTWEKVEGKILAGNQVFSGSQTRNYPLSAGCSKIFDVPSSKVCILNIISCFRLLTPYHTSSS